MKTHLFLVFIQLPFVFLTQDVCNENGLCQGNVLEGFEALTSIHCMKICKKSSLCQWYSFNKDQKYCLNLESCDVFDENEVGFVSGQVDCPLPIYSKLLVTTGDNWSNPAEGNQKISEVVDLSNDESSCNPLKDFPIDLQQACGGLINDSMILICGGFDPSENDASNKCFLVNGPSEPVAYMKLRRNFPGCTVINDTLLWMTGGLGLGGLQIHETTEFIDLTTQLAVAGPDLPAELYGHCMVSINETTVLLTGGYGNDWPPSGSSYLSYFFNIITYQWTPGPSMMNSYVYHDCTILKTNGTTIAMLANNYHVEFLDMQNPSEWYPGPSPDESMNPILSYEKLIGFGNSVVTIGDDVFEDNHQLKKLECLDGKECRWSILPQVLDVPRTWPVALAIPDDLTNCS